ncbi:hypothetical protein DFJ77DRAFT_506238 [Powellomyces hirtus]|nr:hypothetical protein DFJ77DRAFT_506238 [Powellomyces hirtus]
MSTSKAEDAGQEKQNATESVCRQTQAESEPPRIVRGRSVTISGTPPRPVLPAPLALQEPVSSWDLLNEREVVEEVVATATHPYIVGKAEDIDAVLETANVVFSTMKGSGSKKRAARSQSVGSRDRPTIGDIDGYIGAAPSGSAVASPRFSFATRLASGIRNSVSKMSSSSALSPIPLAIATREIADSQMSFADSFPAVGRSFAGLPAPVPAAAPDTLPESHFPQTLTGASEDIDVLTSYGSDNPSLERTFSGNNKLGSTNEDYRDDEEDIDVDQILSMADINPPTAQSSRVSASQASGRAASADRWGKKSRTRTSSGRPHGSHTTAQSEPNSPMTVHAPRVHQLIILSANDKKTDIDDVLATDPDPGALVFATLPHSLVDAGAYSLLDDVALRHKALGGKRIASWPVLNSIDEDIGGRGSIGRKKSSAPQSASAEGVNSVQSCHAGTRNTIAMGRSGRPERHVDRMPNQNTSPEIARTCIRDDSVAAEDIFALVDIGRKIPISTQTKKVPRVGAQDIQMLVIVGEKEEATTPAAPARSSGASESEPPQSGSTTVSVKGLSRVSYTELDANFILAEYSTSPTAIAPALHAGSLDIDQLVAGEKPGGWATRAEIATAHAKMSKGKSPELDGKIASSASLEPTEYVVASRANSRRRSASVGSEKLGGVVLHLVGTASSTSSAHAQRRLTSLDISHFMGIAETVEADAEGIPMGASTMRVDVGDQKQAHTDIKNYLLLGRLPSDVEVSGHRGDGAASPMSPASLSRTARAQKRRGSSMGHLNQITLPMVQTVVFADATNRNETEQLSIPGQVALGIQLRRSLDELALANQFPKQGSLREIFAGDHRHPVPTMASSIVGVRPPKIDIDELVSVMLYLSFWLDVVG